MTKTQKEVPEVLSASVADEVKGSDAIGNVPEKVPSITRYVPWENIKISRAVTDEDVPKVIKEAEILAELCHTEIGVYSGANAVCHAQIDSIDPMRFFVSSSGTLIINPSIVNHTKSTVDSLEACTSFPQNPPVNVQRYHKITALFQQLTKEKTLTEPREEQFSGPEAKAIQHELDHMEGHSIYDEDHNPEWCLAQPVLIATPVKE